MENRHFRLLTLTVLFLILAALVVFAFYWSQARPAPDDSGVASHFYALSPVSAAEFATYQEVPVQAVPRVPAYKVSADLLNIVNAADFGFNQAERAALEQNAFFVRPGYQAEFFSLYESNRYAHVPNFITTDSILHNYHLMFDHLLKRLEEDKLFNELKSLTTALLAESQAQYAELAATEWENAARRNVAFFAVGAKLLDPTTDLPALVQEEAQRELSLIAAHDQIAESAVINMGAAPEALIDSPAGRLGLEAFNEDYSQYVPRGHYDRSELLKNYFRAMMWYGRLTFRLKSEDEVRSAALLTLALSPEANRTSWNKIYEPTNFFVGKSDDITYYQFRDLVAAIYGGQPSASDLAGEPTKFASFIAAARELEAPQINSVPVFNASIQPDREREIKGFRFMGQRFTVDAAIFQRLIDRETRGRMLPKGLDIPAALGSETALDILKQMGEAERYPTYLDNMGKLRDYTGSLETKTWTQNLYWGWLYAIRPLLDETAVGYPSFMDNLGWTHKNLNTFLGSWTELKHDTVLYAKQAYAELGGGPQEEKDDRGYVEPNVFVYARLASLLRMTREGLAIRDLISPDMQDNLDKMEQLVLSLKTISEKELENQDLSSEEYELIRSYGGQLEHFWLEVNKEEMAKAQTNKTNYLNDNPAALVSDVATDPNGQVLEEATGRIFEIFAVVPVAGQLKIVKGGVYSYYEFPWPLNDRLTDIKWREMLNQGTEPDLPAWTDQFIVREESR